ncbi:carboxymuconolactone decarboxylase family protein [Elioraea sp.]|uniref:carboxymuconolactone decarboxylase family protein n=1 Tax=Elioraea sp. TaxID=2185103 RepID=UPI0025C4125C|nr:carboxymuconolactone decarboxylase family protein [Elioraea sp.]
MPQDPFFNQHLFDKGLEVRKAVLGKEYVETSLAKADDFTMAFQEFTTEYCWGIIWNRPGLDRRTRSFLNLAMLIALNRPNELKLHIGGALNNGITKDEIKEVCLQAFVYCGVPASLDAFKIAQGVFAERGI